MDSLQTTEEVQAKQLCSLRKEQFRDFKRECEILMCMGDIYKQRCIAKSTDREHYIYATALYNAALARLDNITERGSSYQKYREQIVTACEAIEFLYCENIIGRNIYCVKKGINQAKNDELEDYRRRLKFKVNRLAQVWNGCPKPESKKDFQFEEQMNQLTQLICRQNTIFVKAFSGELMKLSIALCGRPPCKFTMVGLGSMAREESTPYSDLEYLFLTENDQHCEYFLKLHFHFQLQVLNLGETPLPSVGIKSLNDFYNQEESNDFYDDVTPSGFKLDGNMPWASKIPPGHKATAKKPPLKLIGTPAYMAELSSTDSDKKHGYHLATIISTATRILGDENLFLDFQNQMKTIRRKENSELVRNVCLGRIQEDLQKYKIKLGDFSIKSTKKDYYRFSSTFVNNLKDLHGLDVTSPWEVIRQLKKQSILTQEQCSHLSFMINVAIGTRLCTYCTKGQQHETVYDDPYENFDMFFELPVPGPSRKAIKIPFHSLMQCYLLRLQSISDTWQETQPSAVIMYCQCKLCVLWVKLATHVGPDDIIYDPKEVKESALESYHKPESDVFYLHPVLACLRLKGDHQSQRRVIMEQLDSNCAMSKGERSLFLHHVAVLQLNMKDYAEGLNTINDAIEFCPKDNHQLFQSMMYNKLMAHHMLEDYESVKSCFEESHISQSTSLSARFRLDSYSAYTNALVKQQDYAGALQYLTEERRLYADLHGQSSENTDILSKMLTCYTALGQDREAEKVQDILKSIPGKRIPIFHCYI